VKDNEWMKEKSQLLLEINNLKNEKNSVGWVVDGHNRRIDDLQRENALIKGQLQLSEQQLADYRRKEDVVRQDIQHLNS
jgi:FtsZ-binding cell division protein ZapB